MTTNDHNEKQMMQFTMASRVPDLLMSPVFDPPDVHWFAAGNNDGTWLEIVKSNGRLHLYRMQNHPTEEQSLPLPDLDATAPVVP